MTRLCFLDLETTGLDPDRHEIWEIGLIVRKGDDADVEFLWRIEPDLAKADPNGLRIGRYYERTAQMRDGSPVHTTPSIADDDVKPLWSQPAPLARRLAQLIDGAHIVGAVPSFDAAFLSRWLPQHGQAFTAHYHLVDVESMAVGYLHGRKDPLAPQTASWNSDDLSVALGLDPDAYERHTALGDARWVRDQYDAITH